MESIGTKSIEVSYKHFEDFDVYQCNCKIGDTVWFDDGFPNEDGTIFNHCYMKGVVEKIDYDHWWIYEDGGKELGNITVKVIDDGYNGHYNGQEFSVAFKDIIYEEPSDGPTVELILSENDIYEIAEVTSVKTKNGIDAIMNKYGGPIWMDFQPGSYIKKDGTECYSQKHKCEYVDKELIRELYNKWINTGESKYQKAFEYFLNN